MRKTGASIEKLKFLELENGVRINFRKIESEMGLEGEKNFFLGLY